jgi:hypothetical protein
VPIRYDVRAKDVVVILTLQGSLAVQDYARVARELIADADVQPGFGLLVDGRALDPLPNVEELRALVDVARQVRARGVEPFALVAGNELQFVVGQLFATLAGAMINLDARVFRSIDIALDWLKVSAAKRPSRPPPEPLGGSGSSADMPA